MAKGGGTIFLTTHYIEEAENLCNRVAIMNKGKIVAMDTPAALCGRLGRFTVEWDKEDERAYRFFDDKKNAADFAAALAGNVRIRRTNLEDVFIELTGRKSLL